MGIFSSGLVGVRTTISRADSGALGEVDGVDAFKKRSEITIKHQSIEEVEQELLETLARLEKRTIDVHAKVVRSENNT